MRWQDTGRAGALYYPIWLSYVTGVLEQEYEARLRPLYGEKTIVRVDRAEPSKNILRGFRAFDSLLEHYPDSEYVDEAREALADLQ